MRRSSRGVQTPAATGESTPNKPLPELSANTAPRLAELCLFEPTHAQLRARAAFWVRHRADPLVDPAHMTGEQVARMLDLPSVAKWWRDPGFRNWFLQREEWREEVEYSLLMALRELSRRLRRPDALTTKDITVSARMLAELAGKVGRGAADEKQADHKLTDADAMRVFRETALALGYAPPAELPPPAPEVADAQEQ